MKTKLIVSLLAIATTSLAQSFNPVIQLRAARNAFHDYKNLQDKSLQVDCKTADKDALRYKVAFTYCEMLRDLYFPSRMQVTFASYAIAQQDGSALQAGILSFLSSAAESRLDSQNGASSSGSGTTSVVERSGISDVLGVALESGAVTQSVSGTNLTLQGNSLSLYRFLSGQEAFQYCPQEDANCRGELQAFLNKLSGSATLGLSSSSTQTVTGTVANSGSASQTSASALIQDSASHLTGFAVRFQAINSLDLRSQTYLAAWKKAIADPSLTKLAQAIIQPDVFKFFQSTAADDTWVDQTLDSVKAKIESSSATDADVIAVITKAWNDQNPTWIKEGMSIDALKQFLQAANAYMAARDLAINNVRQSLANGLTFEYDYSRPSNQPRISTARVIYTFHPGIISADTSSTTPATANKPASTTAAKPKTVNDSAITFNFAADMYDSPPPGTSALKDLQAALQLDHHFGNAIATLAGYYQYQHSASALTIGAGNLAPGTNIVLNGTAATLLAPKGNIVVAQAMITFPLKSGTKLPVGVTWSNRTDLLKGNELRGHVGFNFDWSSLLLGNQAKAANPSQP